MELPNIKGVDILVDKMGNAFLVLKYGLDVVSMTTNIIIPYAEVDILFKSPLTPDINITRLLAGDFKRVKKMTYPEAERSNATAHILYSKKTL